MKKISVILDWLVFLGFPLVLWYFAIQPHAYHSLVEWGEWSLDFLLVIIFMKPILVAIGHPRQHKILHFRRHLGIISFWLALFHTGGIIWLRGWRDIDIYLGWNNYLFRGSLAMIGMLILALTSNYYSVKKLKKRWKRIQYIAYPALFMTMIHEALVPITVVLEGYSQVRYTATIFGIFIGAKIIEYCIKNKKIPSLYSRWFPKA